MSTEAPATPVAAPHQDTSVTDWMGGLGKLEAPGTEPAKPNEEQVDHEGAEQAIPPVKPAANTKPAEAGTKPTDKLEQPVAKKDDAPPEDLPADKWPRTAQEWKKFIAARDKGYQERDEKHASAVKELESVRKEIEQVKKAGPSPELDSLKKERDELSERLRIADVTSHPKFKAYFENKTNAQIELAKRVVGTLNADRIVELLKAPDSTLRDRQIEELSAELSPLVQSRLGAIINQLADIDNEKQSEISKARESYDSIQAEKTNAAKQSQAQYEQDFEALVKEAQKGPLFQTKEGDEAWNAGVKSRLDTARTLLFGNPGSDVVMKAAMAAVSLPAVIQGYQNLQSENEKLQAQIKELSSAQPKVQNQEAPKTGSTLTAPKVAIGNDPMQAAKDFMKYLHAPTD